MAIKINNSNEAQINQITLYTGLANVKVAHINPTKDELSKFLGVEIKEEPKYKDLDLQKDGNLLNKIVFHVLVDKQDAKHRNGEIKPITIKTRIEVLVKNEKRVASTGKTQFVNAKGQFTWADSLEALTSNENMKWFTEANGIREAKIGEEQLYSILMNWFNHNPKDNFELADIGKICSGDVSELKGYLKGGADKNSFTVYLDVTSKEDKDYQQVYGKCFSRPTITLNNQEKAFTKAFNEQSGAPKTDFKSFMLQEFSRVNTVESPDSEAPKKRNDFV